MATDTYRWSPHEGPQTFALARTEKEVLYGGARGGGKSEAGIVWIALPAFARNSAGAFLHPYYRGLVVRRHADDLRDWIDRAEVFFKRLGARKVGRPVEFHFPSGAKILTGHLRDSNAFSKYIGHEYQRMLVEEVTLIGNEDDYVKLISSCRSKYPDLPPQMLLTTNPGGPGHAWVRGRFIVDESGRKRPVATPFKGPDGNWRIYVPATVDDNPTLVQNDPSYVAYLDGLPPTLRRAWRYGDWDAFVGQYFPEFRPYGPVGEEERLAYPNANHVIPAGSVKLEPWYHRWLSCDWGFDHPASVTWFCLLPNGQVHVYRELHVRQTGVKELGAEIAKLTYPELLGLPQPHVTLSLDPRTWAKTDEGKTHAQQIVEGIEDAMGQGAGFLMDVDDGEPKFRDGKPRIIVRKASNARVAGWSNIRDFLRFKRILPDESEFLPRLQIWDSCPHTIEQLQTLVFDTDGPNPEDALKINARNGIGGDDAADSLRYGLMAHTLKLNTAPLQVYVAERLAKLTKQYNGSVDPTIAYMVAEKAEADYAAKQSKIAPVSHLRLSSHKSPKINQSWFRRN